MASVYDPASCVLNFGGLLIEGYAEGTFINFEFQDEGAQSHVGELGEAVVNVSYKRNATCTVQLMATGRGRETLSILRGWIQAGNAGAPIGFVCESTGEAFTGGVAVIKQQPGGGFGGGSDPTVREIVWEIPALFPVTTTEQGVLPDIGVI